MRYLNIKQGPSGISEIALGAWRMGNYTEKEAPEMSYTSKGKRVTEFQGIRNMVLLVGGVLSFIMGLIGILNFINSILTSIIARRREFAVLCSIGMTGGQLRKNTAKRKQGIPITEKP